MGVQRPEHGAKKVKKEGPEGVRAKSKKWSEELMTGSMKAVGDGFIWCKQGS